MSNLRELTTRELRDIWSLLNSYHYILATKYDYKENEMLNFYIDYVGEILSRVNGDGAKK